jgi:hypothetical protein
MSCSPRQAANFYRSSSLYVTKKEKTHVRKQLVLCVVVWKWFYLSERFAKIPRSVKGNYHLDNNSESAASSHSLLALNNIGILFCVCNIFEVTSSSSSSDSASYCHVRGLVGHRECSFCKVACLKCRYVVDKQ